MEGDKFEPESEISLVIRLRLMIKPLFSIWLTRKGGPRASLGLA